MIYQETLEVLDSSRSWSESIPTCGEQSEGIRQETEDQGEGLPLNYNELTYEGELRERNPPPSLFSSGENFHLPFDFQVDHQYWIPRSSGKKHDESPTNKER